MALRHPPHIPHPTPRRCFGNMQAHGSVAAWVPHPMDSHETCSSKTTHNKAKPTAPTATRTPAACTASPEGAAALLVVMDGVLESVEAAVGFAVDIKDDIIGSPASHGNHCVLWLERARRTPQYRGPGWTFSKISITH
jgi:hypothetical protein